MKYLPHSKTTQTHLWAQVMMNHHGVFLSESSCADSTRPRWWWRLRAWTLAAVWPWPACALCSASSSGYTADMRHSRSCSTAGNDTHSLSRGTSQETSSTSTWPLNQPELPEPRRVPAETRTEENLREHGELVDKYFGLFDQHGAMMKVNQNKTLEFHLNENVLKFRQPENLLKTSYPALTSLTFKLHHLHMIVLSAYSHGPWWAGLPGLWLLCKIAQVLEQGWEKSSSVGVRSFVSHLKMTSVSFK